MLFEFQVLFLNVLFSLCLVLFYFLSLVVVCPDYIHLCLITCYFCLPSPALLVLVSGPVLSSVFCEFVSLVLDCPCVPPWCCHSCSSSCPGLFAVFLCHVPIGRLPIVSCFLFQLYFTKARVLSLLPASLCSVSAFLTQPITHIMFYFGLPGSQSVGTGLGTRCSLHGHFFMFPYRPEKKHTAGEVPAHLLGQT